jgi:hypothetical protein
MRHERFVTRDRRTTRRGEPPCATRRGPPPDWRAEERERARHADEQPEPEVLRELTVYPIRRGDVEWVELEPAEDTDDDRISV